MAGKKRDRIQNPKPFLPADDSTVTSRKRSKAPKRHQDHEETISENISAKILKVAKDQEREIEEEENKVRNPDHLGFADVFDDTVEEEEDIDDFAGYHDTGNHEDYEDKINEEDEKLLESFLSKDNAQQRTLADIIAARIREQDAAVSAEARPEPKLDDSIIELYKGVGKALNKYTSGKVPKAFKHIPSMQHWQDILYLTEPEKWSENAMYQATRIFASNMGAKKAERFYKLVLLPRVREDIRKNKRLHFALYRSVIKSMYKPSAFNKGILLPLCESGTCSLREAVIIGSIIEKKSLPALHGGITLLRLAAMEYCGTTSYFMKLIIDKKYALPYRVIDGLVAHFIRFTDDSREMPVIWHQCLLAFVQRYKNELQKEDKSKLKKLMEKQLHRLITPEVLRELDESRNRGEKEDDAMMITSPISVINKTIVEDRFDIPDVPMEED
ncbi:uncharacterized protein [Phyllobates terribilis]|uniref:uncharacterized protein n=1 Tax=Phyllobates terribilis TaxID=111132 RepID=UPI003CCB335F